LPVTSNWCAWLSGGSAIGLARIDRKPAASGRLAPSGLPSASGITGFSVPMLLV